jgi:hypothetical protein
MEASWRAPAARGRAARSWLAAGHARDDSRSATDTQSFGLYQWLIFFRGAARRRAFSMRRTLGRFPAGIWFIEFRI